MAAQAAMRALRAAALTAVVAAGVSGDGWPSRPNVLVIVVDALRADHLAAYGYARETSPTITRLAAEGLRVANAYAQGPTTVPTHASLFTGRFPFQHGSYDVRYPLGAEALTLAEFFAAHGYRTFAVASSVRFDPSAGFAQGFQDYERTGVHVPKPRLGEEVTRRALRLLAVRDARPFFGFLHYLGPHQPYMPPEPHRSRWHPGRASPRPEESGRFLGEHRDRPVDADTLAYLVALYDGEISHLDVQLARLFAGLAYQGQARNTIVLLTSDHGEEFKEHGGLSHGGGLHEELLRVPLILRWPARIAPGRVLSRPVQSVDVFPTLVALAGLEPPADLAGRDVSRRLLGSEPPPPSEPGDVVFAQGAPDLWAITATLGGRRLKYVHGYAPVPALYDLTDDPRGGEDVRGRFPEEAARLHELAARLGVGSVPLGPAVEDVPARVREQLRALGYVEEADGTR
jgi:arylsulfatase A-like enzyme